MHSWHHPTRTCLPANVEKWILFRERTRNGWTGVCLPQQSSQGRSQQRMKLGLSRCFCCWNWKGSFLKSNCLRWVRTAVVNTLHNGNELLPHRPARSLPAHKGPSIISAQHRSGGEAHTSNPSTLERRESAWLTGHLLSSYYVSGILIGTIGQKANQRAGVMCMVRPLWQWWRNF